MNELELTMTMSEFGVDVPDKCKPCPRLGALAAQLSQAQDNRNFAILTTEHDVLDANIRAQLTAQMKEHYPNATDEQIARTVENSVNNFFADKDKLATYLRQAGQELEAEDKIIETTLGDITTLLAECPPDGHGTDA